MMEESGPSKNYFPSSENKDNSCEQGKGEGLPSQLILECRARLLEKLLELTFD